MTEVLDLEIQCKVLELSAIAVWIYDSSYSINVWGNSSALQLFGVDIESFKSCQADQLDCWSPEQLKGWQKINSKVHQAVEVEKRQIQLSVTSSEPVPGFLRLKEPKLVLKVFYKPITVLLNGVVKTLTSIQVVQHVSTVTEEHHMRLVDMCNNHPMFQFLFDESGKLLAANKRALCNMGEHLGYPGNFSLQNYLSIGECDGSLGPDQMYREAMDAIFRQGQLCHRFPQLRWSKRHPGKFRWVLYEMWPQVDPVTQERAVLVCEQNISQVKAMEEQIKKQNQRLEAQLEEALAQRDPVHRPAIDIDTPADKTLKLLDKIMRGHDVSAREAIELRDEIVQAGDLRQPMNFNEQLMKKSHTVLDNEVSQSLIQLLSTKRPTKISEGDEENEGSGSGELHYLSKPTVTQDNVRALIAIHRNLPDQVVDILSKVDDWQFDAFKLNEVSGGRPLSYLSFALFKRFNLVENMQMDEHRLVKFLMRVEDRYPNNPYHNRIHAADVLQSLHVLVVRGGLIKYGYCDEIALLSCYLSAIIHDFEHKGVNNDYLVRVSDMLAILYNDRSPMENHHLAASFQLLNSEEYNFLRKLPPKMKDTLRKQTIEMVLVTDMKQHFAIHSMFQAKLQISGSMQSGGTGSGGKSIRGSPHSNSSSHEGGGGTSGGGGSGASSSGTHSNHNHSNHSSSSSSGSSGAGASGGGANGDAPVVRPTFDEDQRSLVLQVALKCADLGHLASPREVHKVWVQHLEEEFFRQGDREKQNGLSVSPLMDRDKNGISMSQVGFFDIVALPLFQSFAHAFPESTPMLDAVKDNYAMWREEALSYSSSRSR